MDERTSEVSRRHEAGYDERDRLPGEVGFTDPQTQMYREVDYSSDMAVVESTVDEADVQTQAIRLDIEQTRADLADTINELQERLNPQTIVEQAKDSALELIEHAKDTAKDTAEEAIDNAKQAVHDATIGKVEHMVSNVSDTVQETGSGIMGLIKNNPVPAALAGLGLGWLYMKRNEIKPAHSSHSSSQGRPNTNYGYYPQPASLSGSGYSGGASNYSGNSGSGRMGSTSGSQGLPNQIIESVKQNPVPAALAGLSIGYMLMQGQGQSQSASGYQPYSYPVGNAAQSMRQGSESLGDKVGNLAGGVGDKVGTVAGGAAGAVGTVAGGVGDVVGNVASGAGDMVGNVAEGVGYQAERVTNGLERLFNDKPLVVGALAIGAGAFIGLMLPETRQEKELLGGARDQLVGKVQEVASETMEKVGQVTEQVQNTVRREAEDKGLIQS